VQQRQGYIQHSMQKFSPNGEHQQQHSQQQHFQQQKNLQQQQDLINGGGARGGAGSSNGQDHNQHHNEQQQYVQGIGTGATGGSAGRKGRLVTQTPNRWMQLGIPQSCIDIFQQRGIKEPFDWQVGGWLVGWWVDG